VHYGKELITMTILITSNQLSRVSVTPT